MTNMWGYDKPKHYVLRDKEVQGQLDDTYPGEYESIFDYNKPMGLVIHADTMVTDEFLKNIMNQVPDSISITFFRSVINSSGEIEVEKIIRE